MILKVINTVVSSNPNMLKYFFADVMNSLYSLLSKRTYTIPDSFTIAGLTFLTGNQNELIRAEDKKITIEIWFRFKREYLVLSEGFRTSAFKYRK